VPCLRRREDRGTLELFHLGVALILLGLAGWMGPLLLGDRPLPAVIALMQAKEVTAEAEKARGQGKA